MERNEKENGLTVNIENYTGEKPIEIVYREGAAPKSPNPLETKEPEKIGVSGVISTPFDWLEKRIGTIDQKGFRQSWVSSCELTVCCLPTKKSA